MALYCDRKGAAQVSDKAKRLGWLIKEMEWLTRSVPLLVRVVLQEAVARAPQENWASRPFQDIYDIPASMDAPCSKAIAAHHCSLMGFQMAGLSGMEKMELLRVVSRRLQVPACFL